jgi:hypothetical protein
MHYMIYTPKNSKELMLVDSAGNTIPHAHEFNDETQEVKFFVQTHRPDGGRSFALGAREQTADGGFQSELILASAIIPGAKMIPKPSKETTL